MHTDKHRELISCLGRRSFEEREEKDPEREGGSRGGRKEGWEREREGEGEGKGQRQSGEGSPERAKGQVSFGGEREIEG